MLHIYLCDYLRKRGYSQAAHALSSEARLDRDRKVPIDSPESLLFEWWVVFSEVLASRSAEVAGGANGGLSEDARVYAGVRPAGMPETRCGASNGVSQVMVQNGNGHQTHSGTAATPSTMNGRRSSQACPSLNTRPNEPSPSTSSFQTAPATQSSSTIPQQQRRRSSLSTLPSLDLEASATLGLHRPASRSVIQQCMDMMNLGAKQLVHLTAQERQALAKRVDRLQSAQNDAQMALAQLHGLQPKTLNAASPTRKDAQEVEGCGERVGQKRKLSPGTSQEPDWGIAVQAQRGPVQSLRRLSQPTAAAVMNAPSPMTPVSAAGMPFSQVSPHTVMQSYSPASAPGAMAAPPARRRSLLANELVPGGSPNRTAHPSGLAASPLSMATSMSPIAEWPAIESQAIPQQRPGCFEAYHQPQPSQPMHAHTLQGQGQLRTNAPLGNAHLTATPLQQPQGPKPPFQVGIPPTTTAAKGYASNAGVDTLMAQQGGAPVMPFGQLEWDLNVLLSNPTLGRDETAALARQLGDVGSS